MAERLRWDEALADEFLTIEHHHQELLDGMIRLLSVIEAGPPWTGLAETVHSIEVAYRAHLVEEEWMMRWIDYPALEEQVEHLRAFLRLLESVRTSTPDASPADHLGAWTTEASISLLLHIAEAVRVAWVSTPSIARFLN